MESNFIVVSICDFSNDYWRWASFHLLIDHLHIFFEETHIQIFYLFLKLLTLLILALKIPGNAFSEKKKWHWIIIKSWHKSNSQGRNVYKVKMILQSRTKQDVIAVNRQKVTSRIHSLGSLELCTYFYTYLKKIGTYPSSTVIQSLFLPYGMQSSILSENDFHSSQNKKSHPSKGYYINYWPISSIS